LLLVLAIKQRVVARGKYEFISPPTNRVVCEGDIFPVCRLNIGLDTDGVRRGAEFLNLLDHIVREQVSVHRGRSVVLSVHPLNKRLCVVGLK
jgi:hypothetical protein